MEGGGLAWCMLAFWHLDHHYLLPSFVNIQSISKACAPLSQSRINVWQIYKCIFDSIFFRCYITISILKAKSLPCGEVHHMGHKLLWKQRPSQAELLSSQTGRRKICFRLLSARTKCRYILHTSAKYGFFWQEAAFRIPPATRTLHRHYIFIFLLAADSH